MYNSHFDYLVFIHDNCMARKLLLLKRTTTYVICKKYKLQEIGGYPIEDHFENFHKSFISDIIAILYCICLPLPFANLSTIMSTNTYHCFPIDGNLFAPRYILYGFTKPDTFPPLQDFDYTNAFGAVSKIAADDLTPLVRSVSFWFDGRDVRRNLSLGRNVNFQYFSCSFCDFVLNFVSINDSLSFCDASNNPKSPKYFRLCLCRSKVTHSLECKRKLILDLPDHNKIKVMEECPAMYVLVANANENNSPSSLNYSKVLKDLSAKYSVNFSSFGQTDFSWLKTKLKRKYYSQHALSYSYIPVVFEELSKKNKYITLILQLDEHQKFYRMFCGVPMAAEIYKTICLPIGYVDGAFYRYKLYDGVLIIFCARMGNGSMIILLV